MVEFEAFDPNEVTEVKVSGPGIDFLITFVSLVRSIEFDELEPILLNIDPRPRNNLELRFFFLSSFC